MRTMGAYLLMLAVRMRGWRVHGSNWRWVDGVKRFAQMIEAAGIDVLDGRGEAEVVGVATDSRRIGPGGCFIAVRGTTVDRHAYIAAAADAGATAVVCEDPSNVPAGVAWVRVGDCRAATGAVAQAFHGWPARKLTLLGVTGTNGKTTFAYIVRHILRFAQRPTGMIGTICHDVGSRSIAAANTTPGPVELAELMAEMVGAGLTHAVMEVSSHALDQDRTAGLDFAAATFTNLTGDHIDYHKTSEAYLSAKAKLFQSLAPSAVAVLNRDDPAAARIAGMTAARVLGYSVEGPSDLHGRICRIDASGTAFDLIGPDGAARVHSNLVGRHNVSNCLAAAGAAMAVGAPFDTVVAALNEPIHVPGRCQRVRSAAPFEVLVDYAHTHDALDNALGALRPLAAGKLIVLFGCGGDRDRTKRSPMAAAVQRWADRIVLTQDNPRTEDPQQIIDDVMIGFDDGGRAKLTIQPDRRAAIAEALDAAEPTDVVVLAGKGHEDYQMIGSIKHHFDDVQIAEALLAQRYGPKEGSR